MVPLKAPTAWPAGVTARFLTLAGELLADADVTVDVSVDDIQANARCTACGAKSASYGYSDTARQWAQTHAAHCRALPRPAA
ncbi:hypothetical protein [Streptomyces sp. NBC_00576]|uniref:hypothetical protein n=1 Tax=Streptomyces sp. NBC_00576 TaxID=2903665 RepID=UPI002E807C6E|nr:hypothetical protein [Streptomyces sp. NBC_00576]WUB73917.1 hypothetical protein OG734_29755 [Streptomyces sp. NBC_00576]